MRNELISKLKSVKSIVGAYDIAMNVNELDRYYEKLHFSANDSFRDLTIKQKKFFDQSYFGLLINWTNDLDREFYPASKIASYASWRHNAIGKHFHYFQLKNTSIFVGFSLIILINF